MIRPRPAGRARRGDRGSWAPVSPPCRRCWPTRTRRGPPPTRARRHPEAPPGRHRHGPLVPLEPAHRAPTLAAPARPKRVPRTPSPAPHRPRLDPDRHPHRLPAALAGGCRLPGGPRPPGRGNPAPVVGARHRPHHPGPAGSPGRLILVAHRRRREPSLRPRQAAWYAKTVPTFADVLAGIRHTLWTRLPLFCLSPATPDIQKLPQPPPAPLLAALCYSA